MFAWPLDFDATTKLLSPLIVALLLYCVRRFFEGRPRVIYYVVHSARHPVPTNPPPPPAEQPGGQQAVVAGNEAVGPPPPAVVNFVHTHALVVRNTGKQAAKNVRINHGWFPPSYQIYPPVAHKLEPGQAGSADIVIPVLVPGEQVTISYLYFPPIVVGQIVGQVKSDEAMAKDIQTIPTIPPPKWFVLLLWVLVFIGASTAVYWLLKLLPLIH
jgi:hypothetical protein